MGWTAAVFSWTAGCFVTEATGAPSFSGSSPFIGTKKTSWLYIHLSHKFKLNFRNAKDWNMKQTGVGLPGQLLLLPLQPSSSSFSSFWFSSLHQCLSPLCPCHPPPPPEDHKQTWVRKKAGTKKAKCGCKARLGHISIVRCNGAIRLGVLTVALISRLALAGSGRGFSWAGGGSELGSS